MGYIPLSWRQPRLAVECCWGRFPVCGGVRCGERGTGIPFRGESTSAKKKNRAARGGGAPRRRYIRLLSRHAAWHRPGCGARVPFKWRIECASSRRKSRFSDRSKPTQARRRGSSGHSRAHKNTQAFPDHRSVSLARRPAAAVVKDLSPQSCCRAVAQTIDCARPEILAVER